MNISAIEKDADLINPIRHSRSLVLAPVMKMV